MSDPALILRRGGIEVEQLTTPDEMLVIQEMQREIWGYGEPGADPPYPARALFSLVESGGLVSVARWRGEAAGFGVAWLGVHAPKREIYLHSQLVGVRPRFRRRGIALAVKEHQAEFARSQGIRWIRWTFDPLRAQNARLNLHRLGAVACTYRENYYGAISSRFQAGDPSDRLIAEWDITSGRVAARLGGRLPDPPRGLPAAIECTRDRDGRVVTLDWSPDLRDASIKLEIPAQIDALRLSDPRAAGLWRRQVRECFQHYFARGYAATDFFSVPEGKTISTWYLLRHTTLEEVFAEPAPSEADPGSTDVSEPS